jgi:hypothetical protein
MAVALQALMAGLAEQQLDLSEHLDRHQLPA